jgi:hypothetical protein
VVGLNLMQRWVKLWGNPHDIDPFPPVKLSVSVHFP